MPPVNNPSILSIFLWLWVIGIAIAYLHQFSGYMSAILSVVGLA